MSKTSKLKINKDAKIEALERRLRETEAQLAHVYHFASVQLNNARRDEMMGSGVIVSIRYLGGKEVCPSFMLKNGLSQDTIDAIKADLKYSFEVVTELQP